MIMKIEYPNNHDKPIFAAYQQQQIEVPKIEIAADGYSSFPETYITNHSISMETAYYFFVAVQKYQYAVLTYHGNNLQNMIIKLTAFILTQETNIIVRHDRWLYFYNGKIYQQCTSELDLLAKIRELCENAKTIWQNFSCDSATPHHVLNNVKQMAPNLDYPYDISNYIVFNNGVLNLSTRFLENFTPERFMTNMVVVDWIPEAESCPVFDNIIQTYTQGDAVLEERILQALGVCLTNDAVKKYICFLGITNSGKSFLLSLLLNLLNDESVAVMQPNDFSQRFAASMIYGKSVCACMDMDSAPLNTKATAFLKSTSGFDMIGAEFKHENGLVMFRSRVHVILCSNFDVVPEIPDAAMDNRKLVIPFQYKLTDDAVPFEILMDKLEKEKPAIVSKLIKAFLQLKTNNYEFSGANSWYNSYVPPMAISMGAKDSLKKFIEEKYWITNDDNDVEFTDDMYENYKNFAAESDGLYRFSSYDAFSKELKAFTNLTPARMRKNSQSNPQSCYTGIVHKTPIYDFDTPFAHL